MHHKCGDPGAEARQQRQRPDGMQGEAQVERRHRAERGPGRHPQNGRVGERIAKQTLQRAAAEGQAPAHTHADQDARQADLQQYRPFPWRPHGLNRQTEGTRQDTRRVTQRNVGGAKGQGDCPGD